MSQNKRQKRYLDRWQQAEPLENKTDKDEYVEKEIDRIKIALGLDDATSNIAQQIYENLKEQDMLRGRPIDSVVISAIYISCRQMSQGISVTDLSEVSSVRTSNISSAAKDFVDLLGLSMGISEPEDYLERILKDVNSIRYRDDLDPVGDDVIGRAREIIEESKEAGIVSGKSPTAFAGAAIYLAGKELGKDVRQSDCSQASDSSEVTIRLRYKEQKEMLES